MRLVGNTVSGNLMLTRNEQDIFIQNNRITGQLGCAQNAAIPKGGQNYVQGDKTEQCRAL